jgi:hypothetical protein
MCQTVRGLGSSAKLQGTAIIDCNTRLGDDMKERKKRAKKKNDELEERSCCLFVQDPSVT